MAAVGLSWENALYRCPPNVDVACHNSADLVTVSGEKDSVEKFVQQLNSEGIFSRMVDSKGYAYHSSYMRAVQNLMLETTEKVCHLEIVVVVLLLKLKVPQQQ